VKRYEYLVHMKLGLGYFSLVGCGGTLGGGDSCACGGTVGGGDSCACGVNLGGGDSCACGGTVELCDVTNA